jgi:hypothetical protein
VTPPAAQWLEILTAIRRDIQELRAEHRPDAPAGRGASPDPGVAAASAPGTSPVSGDEPARPRKPGDRPKVTKVQSRTPAPAPRKRTRKVPPKQDEWGFFDPEQCGFAALLAKLEEIEGDEPATPERS